MKRSAKAELRSLPVEDLQKQAAELREQIFKGRVARAVEGKGLGAKARDLRRRIARLETIITERGRAQPGTTPVAGTKPVPGTTKGKA
jgi:ribosomal protein L29